MSLTISNLGYKVKIKDEVIEILKLYRQIKKNDFEAGGMLIGYETINGNIIIEYATEPFKKDIRSRFSFDRKDKKHNKILRSIWKTEGEIHSYIGEWHTHPEMYPKYSTQDKKNWIQIGDKMNKVKFVHIIVGNKAISLWEYNSNDKKIFKMGEIKYEE